MKRYILFLLVFTGIITTVEAQVINDMGIEGLLLETKDSDILYSVEGSPYWNDKFIYGIITVGDKKPLKAFMRYNAEKETVEIRTDQKSEKTYVLPLNRKAFYKIGDENFLYEEVFYDHKKVTGYFIEHYKGDRYRLLEKPVISKSRAVKAKSSYESDKPATIKVSSDFYIVDSDGSVMKVRIKNRDIKRAFRSANAKEFFVNHKIREKEDLVELLKYLDQ